MPYFQRTINRVKLKSFLVFHKLAEKQEAFKYGLLKIDLYLEQLHYFMHVSRLFTDGLSICNADMSQLDANYVRYSSRVTCKQ